MIDCTAGARIVALSLTAAIASPTAQALTPAQVFAKVSPSIWLIRTYDEEGLLIGRGSAVVVAPDTLLTNCHVLRKTARFVVARDKATFDGTLSLWDVERDICQVQVHKLEAPAVEAADTHRLMVGQAAYAVGAPFGLELTLSAGLVSGLRKDEADRLAMIQTSAPISPGSSGGGLFDEDGKLIGITTSTISSTGSQNLNFAIPVDAWRELPQRHAAARSRSPATQAPTPASPAPPTGSPGGGRKPALNERAQAAYTQDYLSAQEPRAFAISDNGHYAWASLGINPRARALWNCEKRAGRRCTLYALDNKIVYHSAEGTTAGR